MSIPDRIWHCIIVSKNASLVGKCVHPSLNFGINETINKPDRQSNAPPDRTDNRQPSRLNNLPRPSMTCMAHNEVNFFHLPVDAFKVESLHWFISFAKNQIPYCRRIHCQNINLHYSHCELDQFIDPSCHAIQDKRRRRATTTMEEPPRAVIDFREEDDKNWCVNWCFQPFYAFASTFRTLRVIIKIP